MWLENDQLKLRALEPEDLDILYAWENDTSLWSVGNTLSPYSRYILKEYIAHAGEDIYSSRQLRLMIVRKTSGKSAGMIDLYDFDPHHRRAGVGIIIDPAYHRQGIGTLALHLLVDYAFGYLHLRQLYAHIPVENTGSRKLFQHEGFLETGKLKDWLLLPQGFSDVFFVQKINQ